MATLRALGAAAVAAALLVWLHPYRGVFAFDPDEGIEAIKALLLAHGHALYVEIWNDQPPLFTHLLRLWFAVFGWDVDAGRALVLLFAAGTVFALYDLVRLESGDAAAVAATVLLTASAVFGRLSVSLMIGLPAVALATLALWALVRWQHSAAGAWLVLAGVLMGAALCVKLFVAVLLPVFALWLGAGAPRSAAHRARWQAPALWLLCSAATAALLLLLLVGLASLDSLVAPHVAARRAPTLARYGAGGLLLTCLADWPLTLIGVAGAALILVRRRWNAVVFPVWIGAVTVVLLGHAPLWYHHQILLTIPFAGAGGIALADVFSDAAQAASATRALRLVGVALVTASLVWALQPGRLPAPTSIAGSPARVVAAMQSRHDSMDLVVATDPMYAFHAGFDVPPALAVLSLARVVTDPRLPDAVAAAFTTRPPQQVLIVDRTPAALRDWIRAAMGDAYRSSLTEPGVALWVRRDPTADAAPGRHDVVGSDHAQP